MNTTTYKRSVASPYQLKQRDAFDVKKENHPIRSEIEKSIGTYNLVATIVEDTSTLEVFKHVPGLVAFLCTLKKDGEIIGIGRGHAILNRMNRFVERTVRTAFNSSLIDSMIRSTKVLDTLNLNTNKVILDEAYKIRNAEVSVITDKQKDYLLQLIKLNVENEDEREEWLAQVDTLTRDEASRAIQTFAK